MENLSPSTETAQLPSGYIESEALDHSLILDTNTLPWLRESETEIALSRCTLQGGETFLLGSVINTHPYLVEAASAMTPQQSQNCNNMFYSRAAGFVQNGLHSNNVSTMAEASTPFSTHVMRNNGGQRVYFGVLRDTETNEPILLKLGVCDKNKQAKVARVLSSLSSRSQSRRSAKES